MVELDILDTDGNIISYLLFGAMYAGNNSKKTIQIRCENALNNVTVAPVALSDSLIPESMQGTSLNSDNYFTLSLNNSTFSDTLSISSISANTTTEIYVLCTIPANIDGGSFMCGIEVEGQTL